MAEKNPGFLLLNNQIEVIETLTDEQAGQLLKAFYQYNNNKNIELNGLMLSLFNNFKVLFDENNKKYKETCDKNRENIQNYWKKVKQANTTEYDRIPNDTMATNININRNINKNKYKYRERENNIYMPTASPTLANIIQYSQEIDFNDDEYCEKFYNHYESIGWVNGSGQKIKNWKLVFNNWVKKDGESKREKGIVPEWLGKEIESCDRELTPEERKLYEELTKNY